ncbi:hypothetical protein, partial [Azospirillum sp. TSH7]
GYQLPPPAHPFSQHGINLSKNPPDAETVAPPNLWGSTVKRRFVGLPRHVSVAAGSAAPASFASGGVLYAASPEPRKTFFHPS